MDLNKNKKSSHLALAHYQWPSALHYNLILFIYRFLVQLYLEIKEICSLKYKIYF